MGQIAAIAAGISLVSSAVSAYSQVQIAKQTERQQQDNIRQQQVQLRLQENQTSIARYKKLQGTLATEEVMLGSRNISAGSGTAIGFANHNISEFLADEHADQLNFAAKNLSLQQQSVLAKIQKKATTFNAWTGFAMNAGSTAFSYATIPGQSLVDSSFLKGASEASAPITDLNRY